MIDRLTILLGSKASSQQWTQTPIKEWSGFTVEDMIEYGLYIRVHEWFDKLTDEDILAIAKVKPLSLRSSPIYI